MKFKNWFWGLFFIIAAIVVVLNQLGYLAGIGLFSLLITIFLLPVLIKSCAHLNFGGILFPLAILGIVYAEPLGITALTPWPILLVALFGSIGLTFLFGTHCHFHHYGSSCNSENFDEVIDVPDDNNIRHRVSFGSSIKYVNSNNLQKADLSCSFGAMKVYFDNAKLQESGANINIDVSFGAMELYFPKEWNVINKVGTSLGGIEEKGRRPSEQQSDKVINLTGSISFGGVEVRYI